MVSRGSWPTPGWLPSAPDLGIAAAFAALGVALTVGIVEGSATIPAIALTVAHSGALVWRRRRPELVLLAMAATATATVGLGWPAVILGPAVLAGVHGLGAARPRRRGLPVLAATSAVMAILVSRSHTGLDTVAGNAICLAIAWWIGDRHRLVHLRAEDAERSSERRAAEAVADERLRIARELHDVVAHALSVIAVQAGTGRVVLDTDLETARSALLSIEDQSRAALGEMRRLLEVMRAAESGEAHLLTPSPGVDDLADLVAATVQSGLQVEMRVEGEWSVLPAGAGLAAYRIVQEALTNVRRHASATRAEVRMAWRPGMIDLEVVDDGRGSGGRAGPRPGHGLVGMRERAALYGGTLEAGDRPGGGFRVAATIPCEDAG
jgi:signal transduction histidine kinase